MPSISTPLRFTSSKNPLVSSSHLSTSSFQSPEKSFSSNIKFQQNKLNKKSIFCNFNGTNYEFGKNLSSFCFKGKEEEKRHTKNIAINNVEPPWKIFPTLLSENMFTSDFGSSFLTNLPMETVHGSGIPISLQIIKMKTRLTSNVPDIVPVTLHSSMVKLISSVLLMIDELLNILNRENLMENSITVSKEMSDSMVLLFKKICIKSPNLFLLILNLVADFIVISSTNASSGKSTANVFYRNLFDFVLSDSSSSKENKFQGDKSLDQRKCYYENLIIKNPNNSLILANYARFLYQNTNDYER